MCKCDYCGKEMLEADGCGMTHLKINGKWYPRIKVGDDEDMMGVEPGERCHDCNAAYGEYHHLGCDSETCPKCGGQIIGPSCSCNITDVGIVE